MNDLNQAVRAELLSIVGPLKEQLSSLEALIGERERELAELRQTHRDAQRALYGLDPSSIPAKVTRNAPRRFTKANAQTTETVHAKLIAEAEKVNGNGGFSVTSLHRDHGFDAWSPSTIQKVIHDLHGQGAVRLDHRGRGGAHFYKVVT